MMPISVNIHSSATEVVDDVLMSESIFNNAFQRTCTWGKPSICASFGFPLDQNVPIDISNVIDANQIKYFKY